jgi:energy-coupling factor transporter ATP-binding protein EcfA2
MRFLKDCFVDLPILKALKDVDSHQCLLLGRTGSGKSALLSHMEQTWPNVSRVVPKEAAFQFVANSTIIRVLGEIGVDLHVFYEYLWKHILCIHIIRECLGVKTEDHYSTMLRSVEAFVRRDQRRIAVIDYLKKYHDQFWEDADEISREVTGAITENLSSSLGVTSTVLKGKIETAADWKEEEKRTLKNRAQTIVNTADATTKRDNFRFGRTFEREEVFFLRRNRRP